MDSKLVKRLGFDAWASNLIANVIENGDFRDGYTFNNDDLMFSVKLINKRHYVSVRAYINDIGWQNAEITI